MGVIQRAIDGAIAAISPQKGLERAEARRQMARTRVINTGYSHYGANTYKKELAGWIYNGGSSREDIEDNLDVLRQRSRDLYMGVPLATGAIKTMRTNVVGRGLRLKPKIDREVLGIEPEAAYKLERQIEKEWELWADSTDCDAARVDNFCELQQLAFVSWLLSGDCLALLPMKKRRWQPYDLRVRLIEADRLSSPGGFDTLDDRIIGGVETDSTGEVIAYHFSKHHPLSLASQPMEWVRVPAYSAASGRRNVIHIMSRERIDQRRGVPFLAPVIEALKQLGRYTDAELVAAVVNGLFSIFIEMGSEESSMEGAVGSNVPDEDRIDDEDETTLEMAPGAINYLQPGEKANATSPGRPNANFSGFVEAVCGQIGASLEIPYELLMKHFGASYSASRGALEEAWKMFKMYRAWMAADFCQVVYEEWLAEAVAKGRVNAPGFFSDPLYRKAYSKAEWNGPARGILDPVKEVTAAEKRVKNGFSTRQSETMEMTGSDYYANVEQLKQEEEKLREVTQNAAGSQQPAAGATGRNPYQVTENRFWNFVPATGTKPPEMLLYGPIASQRSWWEDRVTPAQFNQELAAIGDVEELVVRINSPGGDVFAAHAIYCRLRDIEAKITVKIDGWAASAATIVAMAGDVIQIPRNGVFMIHDPAMTVWDTYKAADFEKLAQELKVIKQSIVNTYAGRTKMKDEDIAAMMQEETWWTGDQAVEKGFCDSIMFEAEPQTVIENARKVIVNSVPLDLSRFKTVPTMLLNSPAQGGLQNTIEEPKDQKGGKGTMDEQIKTAPALEAKYPDLVNQIRTEAVNSERERIKSIMDTAPAGYESIVEDALFKTPVDAGQVALKIVAAQKQAGAKYLAAVAKDAADSGMDGIEPGGTPMGGADDGMSVFDRAIEEVL